MENGFSVLMLLFAAALLLYAGLLALTKNYNMLPLRARTSVKPKNPKAYTVQLAKVVALVAAAPALCGVVGFWNKAVSAVVLVGGFVFFLWLGTRIMRDVM